MVMKKLFLSLIIVLFILSAACSGEERQKQVSAVADTTLFKQAAQAEIKGDFREAVKIYTTIAAEFPDSDHRDKALFMAGYLNFENLGKKDEALRYFNELMDKYPESDLIDDAEFMVKAIKSDKDAITIFEETSGNK